MQEKSRATLATLAVSGSASAEQRSRGSRFVAAFSSHYPVSDWGCYDGGCYFRTNAQADEALTYHLIEAREQASLNRLSAIVNEGESQLVVILNKPSREEAP